MESYYGGEIRQHLKRFPASLEDGNGTSIRKKVAADRMRAKTVELFFCKCLAISLFPALSRWERVTIGVDLFYVCLLYTSDAADE